MLFRSAAVYWTPWSEDEAGEKAQGRSLPPLAGRPRPQAPLECCQFSATQNSAATLPPVAWGSGWGASLADKGTGQAWVLEAGGDCRAKCACQSGS